MSNEVDDIINVLTPTRLRPSLLAFAVAIGAACAGLVFMTQCGLG
jgi:hypothetical protein